MNSNLKVDALSGFRPILWVCVTIDAMLNFDGGVDANANADVKCEQSLRYGSIVTCCGPSLLISVEDEIHVGTGQQLILTDRQFIHQVVCDLLSSLHSLPFLHHHLKQVHWVTHSPY